MIEPINSLAFSIHANKGVYALLLGSGLSRAARIPTGWEITIELVRKVAKLEGSNCEPDPAAWFRNTKKREPDYSELLDAVAKTPAERQQLLRTYWEPTEAEREEGAKLPTNAHRAIANLVQLGYIRVILTTNFDRLMETALNDVGIQSTVLSSPDHIVGALPLIHTQCTIIKIHGDYLDTRIRNTPTELADYPKPFKTLLDRVFDEFGLVIAGWSADWDEALRAAMTRAPYRRFSMYWATRGEPSEAALDLIARRSATVVKIVDADSFFVALSEQVKSLEEFSRPHPLSTEAAIATLKRYISESKYRIAHDDLISREVAEVASKTNGPGYSMDTGLMNGPDVLSRVKKYEAACATLMSMATVAGQWSDNDQMRSWTRAVTRLATRQIQAGSVLLTDLQRYPATLVLYCFGIAAVSAERWDLLRVMFDAKISREGQEDKRTVEVVPIAILFERGGDVMKILPGRDRQYTPLNNHVETLLWPLFESQFASKEAFQENFDRFELLIALFYTVPIKNKAASGYWTVPGSYGWRHRNRKLVLNELRNSLTVLAGNSPFILHGLIGTSLEDATQNLDALERFVPLFRWH